MFFSIIVVWLLIIMLTILSRREDPERILGIYSQPGKWYFLKYYVFYLIITLRRLKTFIFGKDAVYKVEKLEKLQGLSENPLAFDAVFFHAVSQDGFYLCTGLERRHSCMSSGLVYIVLPGYGILCNKELPKTSLPTDPATILHGKYYGASGLAFKPIEPMKKWHVSFKGKMKRKESSEEPFDVELDAEWRSDYPWFLFENEMPASSLAKAMSREPWTKEYFKALKEAHQSHYEQMGYLNGHLKINGKVHPLKDIQSFRDHSFGEKRDWTLMHRYIYHVLHLEDNTRISVGVISQPCTSSVLETGYVCHPDKTLTPINATDLQLYQHAENGLELPQGLCFNVEAGGRSYEIKVDYNTPDAVHYKGNDIQAKMIERFFSCTVNGIPGRGISEWHYNNC